jgi:hypothetical protein
MIFARALLVAIFVTIGACSSSTTANDTDSGEYVTCEQATSVDAGAPCTSANPCPRELRCYYSAGCTAPVGTCEPWSACPDSAVLYFYCGCDGKTDDDPMKPFAYAGSCDAGDAGDSGDVGE